MNLLGCLDTPTSGTYVLADRDVSRMGEQELAEVRKPGNRICLSNV
jgi:putative ABC transport system ATP-binding protein